MIVVHVMFVVLVLVVAYSNYHIQATTNDSIYSDPENLPYNKVGLILGTSKYLRVGGVNPYFRYRIDAAIRLFEAGKVDYLLASGDNSIAGYNEPEYIRSELIGRGVPDERIFLDYAGFRTLDSVVRCREVFGQSSVTIISQEFHNRRAVFIGRHYGVEAVGFSAEGVPANRGLKVMVREVFAKVKAVLDVYILRPEPRFLGEKITIP